MNLVMTEDEIIKKYKANPTDKHINILAELNGCKAYNIKRVLAKAGLMEEPKSPGRKKGDSAKKNQEADKVLNDIKEIESNKTISVREELPLQTDVLTPIPTYLIPERIKKLLEYRLEEIYVEIDELCSEIDKRRDEREEIKAFLRGEFKSEPKNGIHGQI